MNTYRVDYTVNNGKTQQSLSELAEAESKDEAISGVMEYLKEQIESNGYSAVLDEVEEEIQAYKGLKVIEEYTDFSAEKLNW